MFSFSQFYILNVYDGSRPLSEGELAAQLERITSSSNTNISEEAVGVLTGANRTFWAKQRKRMRQGNACNINMHISPINFEVKLYGTLKL